MTRKTVFVDSFARSCGIGERGTAVWVVYVDYAIDDVYLALGLSRSEPHWTVRREVFE
jgi:hypothetical protein